MTSKKSVCCVRRMAYLAEQDWDLDRGIGIMLGGEKVCVV